MKKTWMFFNCKGSEPKLVLTCREVRSCRRRAKHTWLHTPGAAGEELGVSYLVLETYHYSMHVAAMNAERVSVSGDVPLSSSPQTRSYQ